MAELVANRDASAWAVMTDSFRPNLTAVETRLAFLETVSHLEHLRLSGRIDLEERAGEVFYRA
jgi:hypothetical protein